MKVPTVESSLTSLNVDGDDVQSDSISVLDELVGN
jgi:hypothetical protein